MLNNVTANIDEIIEKSDEENEIEDANKIEEESDELLTPTESQSSDDSTFTGIY